jgi:hypothetical protein
MTYPAEIKLHPGAPDFLDLPWDLPFHRWRENCARLEELPRGLSRHPVLFVNYNGELFALKEMRTGLAQSEYEILFWASEDHLPVVSPVGYASTETADGNYSVLITRYLENSLPFRMLFMSQGFERYREHLLDAISGLLVQLHLQGFFWGDCSLSNTLFRRDAGALQAYLVDAETAELHPDYFSPALRFNDLQIMAENLTSELVELHDQGTLIDMHVPIMDTGRYIQQRYQRLWEEITREEIICTGEHYLIQERIRVLNELGFSIGNVELAALENGHQLRLRVFVTDRNFHRDQLYNLTGLDVEEMQARQMMNEIQQIRATQSQIANRSIPLSVAAYNWLENVYHPVVDQLNPLVNQDMTLAELYCQVLEHKWYLSERERSDVGHQRATEDYLRNFEVK